MASCESLWIVLFLLKTDGQLKFWQANYDFGWFCGNIGLKLSNISNISSLDITDFILLHMLTEKQ